MESLDLFITRHPEFSVFLVICAMIILGGILETIRKV
jgi:hypothetical protein